MISRLDESTSRDVRAECGVPGLYVVENAALERLLFDRNLVGLEFRETCRSASAHFLAHVLDEIDPAGWAELLILSKGVMYQLGVAAGDLGHNLPTNMVATSRVAVSGMDATVVVAYKCFDAGGSTLLIGDTVASGATIVSALDEYRKSHVLARAYVFSYAGACVGAQRIFRYCESNGVAVTFLFGLAAFGLGDNGFDLAFLHPATETAQRYRDRASEQFAGKPVSAVGWDFGSQAMAPGKYSSLCWVEAEVWGLHGEPCFALEQKPRDWAQLSHEGAAYALRLPDVRVTE